MTDAWRTLPASEAFEITMGRQRSPKHATGDHLVPYLRAANVGDGVLDLGDVLEMNFTPDEQEKYALRVGDVLVTEGCGSLRELGASTMWRDELPGPVCFQNTLLRLRAVEGVTLPAFVEVWARYAYATGLFAGIAKGTNIFHIGARRIASLDVQVPPLDEQRRIVDLMRAGDDYCEAAKSEMNTTWLALKSVLGELLDSPDAADARIDDLLEHVIGGAWGEAPGEGECEVTALGPSIFAGDPIFIDETLGTLRSLSATRLAKRSLKRFDIVLERSGGTDTQPVGRVVYAPDDMRAVIPSDFQRLLRVDPNKADPRFVFWVLWHRYHEGGSLPFQTHTTNIRNLRIPEYLAQPLALPPRDHQKTIVAVAEAFVESRRNADLLRRAALDLRGAVLSDLLSGNHQIPKSYDALVEAAS